MPDQTSCTPRIVVVTCLRDEGPFIVEWVAHLWALGVAQILAFSNDCSDGTEALLEALAPAGVCHVAQGDILASDGPVPQWRALRAAWDHPLVTAADWLMHLDVDEWIALRGMAALPDLLARTPEAQAIALTWRLFGNAGRFGRGDGMTPDRFRQAAPEGMVFPALGSFFKTLFRRDGPFTGFGVHRPRQSAPPILMDQTGRLRPDIAQRPGQILARPEPGAGPSLAQLNHYSVRSVHEFLVKRGRGLPNRVGKSVDLTYWVERNFNQVTCDRIAAQLPAVRAECARLRDLPQVSRCEAACRSWHDRRLSEILATPEGARLCSRLVLAGDSQVPDAALGRSLLAQLQAAERTSR